MTTNFDKVWDEIKSSQNILLFAHNSPDGDAIGSMVAMGIGLKQLGKTVCYIAGANRYNLERIVAETKYFNQDIQDEYDLAIVVDSSTMDYIYGNEHLTKAKKVIVFDHHDTNQGYGDIDIIKPKAASCGEIIYDFLKYIGVEITREIAEAIYISISTDTGNFVYSNTGKDSHRIMAELYDSFGGFYQIAEFLKTKPTDCVKMIRIGLNALYFFGNNRFVVSLLEYDKGFSPSLDKNTGALTDLIRYMDGIDVAVVARQTSESGFKCSMRSADEKYDVSEFSKKCGGGGHTKAAGFDFVGNSTELLKLLEDYFNTL